jgi:hypothetical protein
VATGTVAAGRVFDVTDVFSIPCAITLAVVVWLIGCARRYLLAVS